MSNDEQSGSVPQSTVPADDSSGSDSAGSGVAASTAVGSIVDGKIVKIKPFGAIVLLPDGAQGLVHISQVSESFVQDINDVLAVDDVVRVKILSKDEANGKITLSIKAADGGKRVKPFQAAGRGKFGDKSDNYADSDPNRKNVELTFDDKLKDWIKQSNERQAGINKRNNRR